MTASPVVLFLKAHIKGYTRRDGTVVSPHEDKRQVALFFDHSSKPDQAHYSNLSNNASMEATGDIMEDYAITRAALGEKKAKRFEAAMETLSASGPIIKARYTELRQDISSYYSDASKVEVSAPYLGIDHAARPEWFNDAYYDCGNLQSLKKCQRTCQAHAGDPLADRALAFFAEWAPIVAKLEARKADITTAAAQRDVAKKVAAAAKPIPSARSRDAMGKLAAAIDAKKPELAVMFKDDVQHRFDYLGREFGPKLDGDRSYKAVQKISNMLARNADGTYSLSPAAVEREAQRYADAVAVAWKDKIDGKLESLDAVEVSHVGGYGFRINGERAGRKVTIEQGMIINRNGDTLFNQFPARIYVDGKATSEADYKAAFKE